MSTQLMQDEALLSRAAGHVRAGRAEVTSLCQQLTQQMAAVQSQWAGRGGQGFQTLVLAWAERQRRIVNALDGFAASLETTERDNVLTDTTQADGALQLARRLG